MLGLGKIASKILGSANDRKVRAYRARVEAINAPRAIARDPERRKSVSELIIMNY